MSALAGEEAEEQVRAASPASALEVSLRIEPRGRILDRWPKAKKASKTLWVALAGIAATALVGLASTGAAWLSARDDRANQLRLADAMRVYDRKVMAYLDAVDFLESQRKSLTEYEAEITPRDPVPYQVVPPGSLTSRLRAFGSTEAFNTFEATQAVPPRIGIIIGGESGGASFQAPIFPGSYAAIPYVTEAKIISDTVVNRKYRVGVGAFVAKVNRFEDIVHRELG